METLRALYNETNGDWRATASQILTDGLFQCGTRIAAQAHRSACQFWLNPLLPGVFHMAELQYVWKADVKFACVMEPKEVKLANRMRELWTNFAKCLDPTCGASGFPKHSVDSPKALVFH